MCTLSQDYVHVIILYYVLYSYIHITLYRINSTSEQHIFPFYFRIFIFCLCFPSKFFTYVSLLVSVILLCIHTVMATSCFPSNCFTVSSIKQQWSFKTSSKHSLWINSCFSFCFQDATEAALYIKKYRNWVEPHR